jgi:PAS domain S-box-containing protein
MRVLGQWFARYAERAARHESRRLVAMLDAIPERLALEDLEGRLVYANRPAAEIVGKLTGRPPTHVVGEVVADHLPDSYRAYARSLHGRAARGEEFTEQFQYEDKWREHHLAPVRDADGKVAAVAVITRDIQARKIAEARLQLLSKIGTLAATLDYEDILDAVARLSIPELADWCVFGLVENGAVGRGKAAHRDPDKATLVEELLRFSPERAIPAIARDVLAGKARRFDSFEEALTEMTDPEQRDIVQRLGGGSLMIVPVVVLGATIAVFAFAFSPASSRRYTADDLALAQEMAGRVGQLIENARLHEKLRESEARFRVALAHSKIAVFEQDTDFRTRWVYNAGFGQEADPSRWLSKPTPELLAIERRVLETGEGATAELEAQFDGERRHFIVHFEALREGNDVVGITGAAVDITETKRAQEELARAVVFRERVMGVLGHDLRNPLSSVLGHAALLEHQPGISERMRDGLTRIVQAAERMNELIETLLDVTRLRVRRELQLSIETVDLGAVARATVDELRVSHRNRAIEVETTGDLRGRWDAGRLAQVVSNLVGNALAHGSAEAPVQLSLTEEDGIAVLAVTNRGPTIPAEVAERMFEPFWQAPRDEPATQRSGGLGLGLFIVREIVRAHGGTIDVRSRDGVTTFTVRLPRWRRPELDESDLAAGRESASPVH